MLEFQKDNFKILKELGVKNATISVRVARPYFKYIQTRNAVLPKKAETITAYSIWYTKLNVAHQEFEMPLYNMNEDQLYTCDYFTDAKPYVYKMLSRLHRLYFNQIIGVEKKIISLTN